MNLSFWYFDHEWTCRVRCSSNEGGLRAFELEEMLAVRRCEDDHLLSPEEVEQLLDKCGVDQFQNELASHIKRQLEPTD